jgi:hypothetical protein
MDIILSNPDKPWHWLSVNCNINFTFDVVQHIDTLWNWFNISKHPNITWDIIQSNPDTLWNWLGISANPNITFDDIQNNPNNPWDFQMISTNKFTKEKELFQLRVQHQHYIQSHILEELVKKVYHPLRIQKYLDDGEELEDILERMAS